MRPAFSSDNLRDGSSRKFVLLANVFLHHMCCQLAYRQYILLSQFCHPMFRASVPLSLVTMQSIFTDHIFHIVSMSTNDQMTRIYT